MRALLLATLLLASGAEAEPRAEYAPLAFLAGHCWLGLFPDGKQSDEHCFTWVYGGQFLRDRHTVRHAGHADMLGETLYFWNAGTQQIEYLYIEDQGGFSRGTVAATAEALVFPPTSYVEAGKTQTYRSRWQHAGHDAYEVVTEFQSGEQWVDGFRVHMQRGAAAPP